MIDVETRTFLESIINELKDIPKAGGGSGSYSYAEQEVGTWIDKRKIYRKSYDLGTNFQVQPQTWKNIVYEPSATMVINCFGTGPNDTYPMMGSTSQSGNIQVLGCRDNAPQYVTHFHMEYLKD